MNWKIIPCTTIEKEPHDSSEKVMYIVRNKIWEGIKTQVIATGH